MDTMKAGIILEPGRAEVREISRPEPGPGEVLVRLEACALCTLEQRAFTGIKKFPMPYLGGHEVAGRIEKTGPGVDPRWTPGLKVAVRTITRCGQCRYCHLGEDTMCERIGNAGRQHPEVEGIGGLAEYFLARPGMLYALDEKVLPEIGALTEPLACVLHSMEQAGVDFGDIVVVLGAGIMGQLHLMLSRLRGASVIMVETDPVRLSDAQKLGAWQTIDPSRENVADRVRELTGGDGADVVIVTPAISALVEQSVQMVAKNGRVVLYGSFHPDTPVCLSPNKIHYSQIHLTGAVNPGSRDFYRAARMISQGSIDLSGFVQGIHSLDQIQEAFEDATGNAKYRVVVRMNTAVES